MSGVQKKKVAIIGSNSFSGASFAKFLLELGHDVIGFSRSPEPNECLLPYKWIDKQENFKFFQMDINHDTDKMLEVLKAENIEYIADYASQGMVGPSWENPTHWYQTNLVGKTKVHLALMKLGGLKAYLRFSTPEVYGSVEKPITEDHPYNPSTPYAVSHAAIDMSLKILYKQYDFPVIFTRAANVYGPGQPLYRIIPRAILYSMQNKVLTLDGGGGSKRSFIHADDVSDISWKLLQSDKQGEIYHLATEEMVSIKDLVSRICEKLEYPFEKLVKIGEDRPGKDKAYTMDCQKVFRDFSWRANINLDRGIEETIAWFHDYYQEIQTCSQVYIHKE